MLLPHSASSTERIRETIVRWEGFIALIAGIFLGSACPAQPAAYPSRPFTSSRARRPAASPTPSRAPRPTACRPGSDAWSWSRTRQGPTGNLAIEHVAKIAPDGYTLLLVAGETWSSPVSVRLAALRSAERHRAGLQYRGARRSCWSFRARCRSRTSPSHRRSPARTRES